jgi:hypothetical protein
VAEGLERTVTFLNQHQHWPQRTQSLNCFVYVKGKFFVVIKFRKFFFALGGIDFDGGGAGCLSQGVGEG